MIVVNSNNFYILGLSFGFGAGVNDRPARSARNPPTVHRLPDLRRLGSSSGTRNGYSLSELSQGTQMGAAGMQVLSNSRA